jgi:hypothetical protein
LHRAAKAEGGQSEWIAAANGFIADVRIEIDVATSKADRILGDEALEGGMVVARPTVPPVASLARKSTAVLMRVAAMRPSAADAEGALKTIASVELLAVTGYGTVGRCSQRQGEGPLSVGGAVEDSAMG